MNALEIKNLGKSYRGFSLEDFSLVLPSGCIMGLVGENGAGKTTVIKLILGMLKKSGGSVKIFGKDNGENPELAKEDIGVVLDEVGIPGCLNTAQVGKIMKNTFKNWNSEAYGEHLRKLKIPEKTAFKDFSRGMKMKLGIAVALSHDAKLLILDEATSGLDPVVRDEVLDLFNEFTRDESHSVLLSSHIVSDLEKICDYVAFMKEGRLILCGEKDRILEQYCLINCTDEELKRLPQSAVIGKKVSEYCVQAIAKRSEIPAEQQTGRVDLEQLFIFMAKEEKYMKGLLLKDFYVLIKECRWILFMIFIMIPLTLTNDSMFFLVYPSILAGALPVTLCSLDERERWTTFSKALPYSDLKLVSSKYIFGLLCNFAVTALNLSFFAVLLTVKGEFSTVKILSVAVLTLAVGLLSGSVSMPFIFRFGAEKGRIFYLISIGVMCALGTLFVGKEVGILNDSVFAFKTVQYVAALIFIVAIYVISLTLSVALYKKREF